MTKKDLIKALTDNDLTFPSCQEQSCGECQFRVEKIANTLGLDEVTVWKLTQ